MTDKGRKGFDGSELLSEPDPASTAGRSTSPFDVAEPLRISISGVPLEWDTIHAEPGKITIYLADEWPEELEGQ